MGDSGSDTPPSLPPVPWSQQTLGERIVTAAWRAVAAHLAQQDAQRVAAGGAGDIDPLAEPDATGGLAPVGSDRLR